MTHEEKQVKAYAMGEQALADALKKGVITPEEGFGGLTYGEAADRLMDGEPSDERLALAEVLQRAEDLWWEEDD